MIVANLVCCCLSLLPGHHRHHQDAVSTPFYSQADSFYLQADSVIESELRRPQGPSVVISNAIAGSSPASEQLSSADMPGFASAVSYQLLNVAVKVPLDLDAATPDAGVQLFLDGRPVDKSRFTGFDPTLELAGNGQNVNSFRYEFQCPAPGQHVLQARYLRNQIWSQLSSPLYFQVMLPPKPQIIAISDAGAFGIAPSNQPVQVSTGELQLKLANVSDNDVVNVYLNGRSIGNATRVASCCFRVNVASKMISGVHELSVRAIPGGSTCALASEPSEAVQIRYYNNEDYLLRPGMGCGSGGGYCVPTAASTRTILEPVIVPGGGSENDAVVPRKSRSLSAGTQLKALIPLNVLKAGHRTEAKENIAETKAEAANEEVDKAEENARKKIEIATQRARAARLTALANAASRIDLDTGIPSGKDSQTRSFYFAAPASFPRPEFGAQGQPVDREGAVIYEDMQFTFDENGGYYIKCLVSTPNVPTELRLQFQVQARPAGPWYTLTMPVQRLKANSRMTRATTYLPNETARGQAVSQDDRQTIMFTGNSEILKRCFASVCDVRRTGTARFGFGVAGLGHLASDTE